MNDDYADFIEAGEAAYQQDTKANAEEVLRTFEYAVALLRGEATINPPAGVNLELLTAVGSLIHDKQLRTQVSNLAIRNARHNKTG